MSTRPLADEIRPQRLDEVVGQRHLIGPGGVLRRLIDAGTSANMIFYGPSGTGKTTIANIIANKTNKTLYRLNATTASLQDVKDIIASVGTLMAPGGILLYLDEIQYFNKKQQQSLLEFMENGSITLIASTTENPFFYVYNALLSRSTVFEFKQIEPRELLPAVERALGILKERSPLPLAWEEGVPMLLATQCGGDVRKAINACELLYEAAETKDGELLLTSEDALQVAQRSAMRYDKGGDAMYDMASALMKSLRGRTGDIPRELQNVHADSTGLEREQGYKYPHEFPNHWVKQQYLPDPIKNAVYYRYGDNKVEQAAAKYWEAIKHADGH